MDSKGYGILATIAARMEAGEALFSEEYSQAKRAAFDAALERGLILNPAHCIFPDNPFTEH
jgi:hypothetical protein